MLMQVAANYLIQNPPRRLLNNNSTSTGNNETHFQNTKSIRIVDVNDVIKKLYTKQLSVDSFYYRFLQELVKNVNKNSYSFDIVLENEMDARCINILNLQDLCSSINIKYYPATISVSFY